MLASSRSIIGPHLCRSFAVFTAVATALSVLPPMQVFAVQTKADALQGYWKFDETSAGTFTDSSGEGRTATGAGSSGTNNTPQPSTDVPSEISFSNARSISFDGTDDALSFSSSPQVRTIAFWLKMRENDNAPIMYAGADAWDTGQWSWAVFQFPGSQLYFQSGSGAASIGDSTFALNTWSHYALVRSDGGQMKLYKNGSLVQSVANTSVIDGVLRIGKASSEYFDGLLDDVRIYSRNLSAREIAELAAGQHPAAHWKGKAGTGFERAASWSGSYVPDPYSRIVVGSSTGALTLTGAVRYAGLTINTGALMLLNGTGTTMLESGTFTNYGTLALKNSETLTSFTNDATKGTIMAMGTGSTTGFKTGTSYYNLTLNDGLVGYWKLDDTNGIHAADSSGYTNSGVLMSGAAPSTAVPSTNFHNPRSVTFDGVNDYISAPVKGFNFGTNTRSIAGWINPTASSTVRVPFAYGNCNRTGGLTSGSFGIYLSNSSVIHFWGCGDDYSSGITATNGAWTHVAATYDGANVRIYVNGSLSAVGTGKTLVVPSRPVMEIGSAHLMDTGNYFFPGQVDDVRVYKRMLTPAEVSVLAAGNQPSLYKGSVTLNAALNLNGNLTLNGGGLDVSSSQYGIILGGSWLNNGGVFVPRSSTVTFTGTSAGMDILSGGQRFAKLTFNGAGGTWSVRDRLTASGTVVMTTGTLDASGSYVMNFGQFAQVGGTIIPRSGTITITSPQSLSNTFTSTLNVLRIEDPTENGLVGYWKFDEGTNTGSVVDSSGYNQHAARSGSGVVWTNSTPSAMTFSNPFSMRFNGVGDLIPVTVGNAFPDGTTSFTQALWVRTTGSGALKTLATRRNQGAWNQSDWPTLFLNQGRVTLAVDDNSYMNTTAYIAINDGEWHHIAGVKNSNVYSLYIDGVLRDSITDSHPMNGSSGLPYVIGRAPSWTGSHYQGDIDDVRVYNRVLSSDEILNLARGRYAAGSSSTATVTLGGNLSTAYLALDSGNLSMGSNELTVTNSLSMLRGRGNLTLGSAITTLGGLVMSGATLTAGAGTLDINGSFTMSTGSLIAPSGYLMLSGDWNKTGGYFRNNSGSVVLDGDDQVLSGTGTFYNLTKSVTSGAALTFGAGHTFTVGGTLVLNGAASHLLALRSSTPGVQWLLNAIGSVGVEYLDVQDSYNINVTAVDCTSNCVDSMNNINWLFPVPVASSQSSSSSSEEFVQSAGGARGKGTVIIMAMKARTALLNDYKNTVVREPDTDKEAAPEKEETAVAQKPIEDLTNYKGTLTIERQRNRVVLVAADARLIYKDVVADAWYAPFVSRVIQDDVARGYKDKDGKLTGEFGVGKNVTRAEILKMALEAAGKNQLKAAAPRNTSAQGSWAASYVGIAESLALSTFTPSTDVNAPAARGEVIQLIMEAMGITIGQTPASYSDVPKNHPYTHAIAAATFFGLIVGDTKTDGTPLNTFRPDEPINRAEASKLIALTLALKKMGAIALPSFGGMERASSAETITSSSSSAAPVEEPQLSQAKVVVQQLKVRIDSRPDADWIGTIYEGHVVTVLWPLDNGWSYIKTSYGKEGYVPSDALGPM